MVRAPKSLHISTSRPSVAATSSTKHRRSAAVVMCTANSLKLHRRQDTCVTSVQKVGAFVQRDLERLPWGTAVSTKSGLGTSAFERLTSGA